MLTSAKEKLRDLSLQAQVYAGVGAMFVERTANKELLLRNPNFRLIHVPDSEGERQPPLRIVIPAVDRLTRHKVREQGYFTVSHLWGPQETWEPWTQHGISCTDGNILEVKIRPEKQEVLLHLLRSNPGYWWIDIFCIQSNEPLSIMGNIYRFCYRCYALVDFPSDEFCHIESISSHLQSLESVDILVESYKGRIHGKMGSADVTWYESLDDLLSGWYGGDRFNINSLAKFFNCQWFARVWTLQEYILPRRLTFISEDDPKLHQFDRNSLTPIIEKLCEIAAGPLMLNSASDIDGNYLQYYLSWCSDQHELVSSTPGLSRCYFDLTRFDAFRLYDFYNMGGNKLEYNLMTLRYGSSNLDFLIIVLIMIARLPRKCMYTRDYIHGISGLLDMNIPAGSNDEEVWASFKKIVQKRAPFVKFSETSPLSGATNMQEAYMMFTTLDIHTYMETLNEYGDYIPTYHRRTIIPPNLEDVGIF